MTTRPSSPGRLHCDALPRLAVLVCSALVVWANVDQVVLPQLVAQNIPPAVPQDDDDDMARPPTPLGVDKPASAAETPALAASPGRPSRSIACVRAALPPAPTCEHDFRNGIGAPLLC